LAYQREKRRKAGVCETAKSLIEKLQLELEELRLPESKPGKNGNVINPIIEQRAQRKTA